MNHSRSQPRIGCPLLVGIGASSPISVILDVELPPDRDEREALKEQRGVAKVCFRCRVVRGRRGTERAEQAEASAVDDVEEDDAVAARRVLRFENEEIGRELDLPLAVSRGEVDIGDDLIARILRVDREVRLPVKFLVGADVAERLAVQDVDSLGISTRVSSAWLGAGTKNNSRPQTAEADAENRDFMSLLPTCEGSALFFRAEADVAGPNDQVVAVENHRHGALGF